MCQSLESLKKRRGGSLFPVRYHIMISNLLLRLNHIRNHRRKLWLAFQLLRSVPASMGENLHRKCCLGLRIVHFVLTSSSWGQCSIRLSGYVFDFLFASLSLSAKYFSASWPSFSATSGFVRHHVLWSSEFSPFSASASEALDCVQRLMLSHDILMSPVPSVLYFFMPVWSPGYSEASLSTSGYILTLCIIITLSHKLVRSWGVLLYFIYTHTKLLLIVTSRFRYRYTRGSQPSVLPSRS